MQVRRHLRPCHLNWRSHRLVRRAPHWHRRRHLPRRRHHETAAPTVRLHTRRASA
jgi:hypothetical protein